MKANDWISVNDRLPDVGVYVFVCANNNKCSVSSMYIPKDCYGNILGDKEWKGSTAMTSSITHWMPIVLPDR